MHVRRLKRAPNPRDYDVTVTLDIVMPFWGDFGHLREAVQSVLTQDDPDWKLIVIDDVYPDPAPGEWLRGIDDKRVTYLRNETNLGPSRNYSKGVTLVDGDFVVIMGCDDRMLPGYVARVKQLIEQFPDADLIQPGVRVIDENGTIYVPTADRIKARIAPKAPLPRSFAGEGIARSLLRGNWTYFPSLVWRRSWVADGFRPDLNVVQDLAKIMDIVIGDGTIVVDGQVTFEYRRHSTSVSAKTAIDGSKYGQELTLFTEVTARCKQKGWTRAARASAWHSTSRLSALSVVPAAIAKRNWAGVRALVRHALSWRVGAIDKV